MIEKRRNKLDLMIIDTDNPVQSLKIENKYFILF